MHGSDTGAGAPRTVVIGGGTGLSTMLRGLKYVMPDITAIVSVADDGGGSGVLRQELGMPPPGDIRHCIQALARVEPTMEALLAYRFREGSLKGQSFGNLFLAALNGMSPSFDAAVGSMCEVLNIVGRVLPVTNADVQLAATFDDGTEVVGESRIGHVKKGTDLHIRSIRLLPEKPKTLPACIEAVRQAELIVLGPGSLYTSVIPNLLTDGLSEAILASDALRVYVCNVMTEDGETQGYSVSDHLRALFTHGGGKLADYCLANDEAFTSETAARYDLEGAEPVRIDREAVEALGVQLRLAFLADESSGYARHDSLALAEALQRLYREESPTRRYGG